MATTWMDVGRGTLLALRKNGFKRTLRQIMSIDQPRVGTHAGTDEYGNNYYYNPKDIVLRDRWIEYGRWNSDPSQIPPEWHQWIHHITDDIPTAQTVPKPFFTGKHLENLTGSRGAYKPYSTTVPKFTSWTPGTKERQG